MYIILKSILLNVNIRFWAYSKKNLIQQLAASHKLLSWLFVMRHNLCPLQMSLGRNYWNFLEYDFSGCDRWILWLLKNGSQFYRSYIESISLETVFTLDQQLVLITIHFSAWSNQNIYENSLEWELFQCCLHARSYSLF